MQTNKINYKSKWFYFSLFLTVICIDRDFQSTVHSHERTPLVVGEGDKKVEGKKEDGRYPVPDS